MQEETYAALRKRYEQPKKIRRLRTADAALTGCAVVLFAVCMARLFARSGWIFALRTGVFLAVAFLCVSLFRRLLDAPRPCDKAGLETAGCRHGRAMPSRHVFSAFAIGATFLLTFPLCGGALLAIGIALAVLRVLLGYHSVADVIAGGAVGAIAGTLTVLLR